MSFWLRPYMGWCLCSSVLASLLFDTCLEFGSFNLTTARRRARAAAAACMLPTNACYHFTFCPLTLTCGSFAAASTSCIPVLPPALSSSCSSKLAVTWSAFRLRAHRIIENVCVVHFPVQRVAVRVRARRGRVFQGSVSVEIVGRVYPETLL